MAETSCWIGFLRRVSLVALLSCPLPALALETSLSAPGASEDLQSRLSDSSSVMSAESRGLSSPQEILAAALADYRTLVQILYDEGYFSPVVNIRLDGREAANIPALSTPSSFNRVEISIQTGRPFTFKRAEIGPLAPDTELPEEYAVGQPATTGAIKDAGTEAIRAWRFAGHPKVKIGEQRVVAVHSAAQLDSDLEVLPGPKLRFGKMTLAGETAVKPESINRIAGFPTGEVYSPALVQKTGTRLRRTGTFRSVNIKEAEQPNADGTLDFEATFEDMPRRRLTFGAELASRTGLDLTGIWMHRNFLGGAERLRFEAQIRNIGGDEDIDGRIGVRLDQPDKLGPDDNIFYLGEIERRNRTHYNETRGLLGAGVRRVFSDDLYAEGFAAYSYSKADDAYGSNRPFHYLVLPFKAEWDRRDNPVSAKQGFFLDARVSPFLGVSGTKSGAQFFVDGRGYVNPGGGRIVLAGRMQIGSVVGPGPSEVTPSFLFFSGGAGTVRGQPYESLGIPVGTGIAGGKSFLGVAAEVRGHVTDNISLVGFFDYGAVDTSSFVSSNSTYHTGAGIGVRYDLGGFGPLRVDLAWPVDGPTDDGMQFYIGIGQAF
ncbi:autotransporter assembly complex protein TamA [Primorskyibacter sp. S87]|uniref:autotransporter assembly complex protein TamA n=1 Tax=Primorskyibacter sp. S87 TaxID=3415126 RepID=UPI003C7AFDC4